MFMTSKHNPKESSTKDPQESKNEAEAHPKEGGEKADSELPITPIDPKDKQIAELTKSLQRVAAEFDNFRKWTEKDNRERRLLLNAQLISKFLPLLDTFDAALKGQKPQNAAFAKGIEMLHSQLLSILNSEGLKSIECAGKKFDPNLHDVMLKEKSGKAEGTVLEEFQKGYLLHGKVLRHSKVKVSG